MDNNTKKRMGEILLLKNLINEEQLNNALTVQKKTGKKLGEILKEQKILSEDEMLKVLGIQLDIEFIDLDFYKIQEEAVHLVSENIARKNILIPIKLDNNTITVAMSDPLNMYGYEDVSIYTGKAVNVVISDSESIKRKIDHYFNGKEAKKAAEDFMKDNRNNKNSKTSSYNDEADSNSAPIVKLVNTIFDQAINGRASDIHIEPFEKDLRVRFRIDGVLYKIMSVETELLSAFVARIKVMSGMDIAERRVPQDGRMTYFYLNKEYEMRVSSLPTVYGEKIVIRIQDKSGYLRGKKDLGFSNEDMEKFQNIISSPHGIILVSGPTGSGKSTTLYTVLQELNDGESNIITVEDPVESKIDGVNQVEVNTKAGLTFASALRSILRQDPDIIMIGEIRDSETAEIAVRSAITGHLVLSTIHTNDAPSSIARLVDMGVENFLISSSLVGVISQRLVRKICKYCKEEYLPNENELLSLGLSLDKQYKLYRGSGCTYCNNKGYIGRTGIYEIMTVNKDLQNIMLKNVSSEEIKDIAKKSGMKTLKTACLEKVLNGETTTAEFLKVVYSVE